jgi:hypothetical protein
MRFKQNVIILNVIMLKVAAPLYDIIHFRSEGSGYSDPGVRKQIFQPTDRNPDGFFESNGRFLTAHPFFSCDSSTSDEIFHNFDAYVK